MEIVYVCLAAINVITFLLFAIDKYKAKHRKWRIRETTLLIFSALGGSVGGLLSMRLFRHKTQTPVFKYGVPCLLLVHIALAIAAVYYL